MRPRALIVEDDRATRDVLRTILEGEGLTVDSVHDGDVAIAQLLTEHYALILLDIVLPTVSGTAVMEHLQLHKPRALETTIVVTGLEIAEIRKVFPSVVHALAKPVLPARLRAAIRSCMHHTGDTAADVFIVA